MSKMDVELTQAAGQLRLALLVLQHRRKRLQNTKTKLSRHYNRVQHTEALIGLLEELNGLVLQDPDNWDSEPELVPF